MVRPLPQVSAPDEIGAGSLKLIVFDAPADAIAQATACLRRHVRDEDMRSIAPAALIIYSHASPADVRDWLAPLLLDGESVLVTEFERWSSRGDAVDRRWLLRRGH
jgi:hypothetical protein